MKKIRFPTHEEVLKPYLKKDKKLKQRIEAGVQRLRVITQIIQLREKLGLTQSELAERVGVSQPYIARIENDKVLLDPRTVFAEQEQSLLANIRVMLERE